MARSLAMVGMAMVLVTGIAYAADDPLDLREPEKPDLIVPPYLPTARPAVPQGSPSATDLRNHRVSQALREHTNRLRHGQRLAGDRPFAFQYSPSVRHSSRILNQQRVDRLGLPRSYLRR